MANAKVAKKSQSTQDKNKEKSSPAAPSVNKPPEADKSTSVSSPGTSVNDAPSTLVSVPTSPNAVRMPSINDVRVAGRLTKDPVIRDVGNQKVANFDLAVEKRYRDGNNAWQKQVSFIPVAVWGVVADRSRDILHKGSPVYLEGRLRSNSWQTKDGQKRTTMQLEAFKVQSLSRSQSKSQGQEIGD